ncbi:hypothetical protein QVD17_42011 [Tagetes erecta]|uniref:F-box domain-containing protein n=1 Tax=Tagetes erecta TaxID=13708 RepID=A0AAD8N966_TARER|nr:hypothetical protein QVD17_42011 [Tagetes erecta]
MSDNLPLEMQLEIMKKLPIKSLIQFRSVSKTWKHQIDSSDFISHYNGNNNLLITYDPPGYLNPYYVSIADDHTFPQHKVSLNVPLLVNLLECCCIIGSSHGLLCLGGFYYHITSDCYPSRVDMVVLWNMSIRKTIPIVVPNKEVGMTYGSVVGFGVCRATTDPKIVKIRYIANESDLDSITSIPWQVEVFTLSTGAWRSLCNNLPRKSIKFDGLQVVVDGFLYWRGTDRINAIGGYTFYNMIMSFDVTTEEFREVNLPRSLARESVENLSMSKLRESLVVLHHGVQSDNPIFDVWMMEDGVSKLFTKLFTINVNIPDEVYVRGFRKGGEPIIEVFKDDIPIYNLGVYDPYSKHVDFLEINGMCAYSVFPYMETLLMLDQPNLEVYNETETIRILDDLASEVDRLQLVFALASPILRQLKISMNWVDEVAYLICND